MAGHPENSETWGGPAVRAPPGVCVMLRGFAQGPFRNQAFPSESLGQEGGEGPRF